MGAGVETSIGGASVGVTAGYVDYKDNHLSTGVMVSSTDPQATLSNVKDDNTSGKAEINLAGDVSVGAQIGVIGVKIKVNVISAAKSVDGMFETLSKWMAASVSEIGNDTFNSNRKPDNQ